MGISSKKYGDNIISMVIPLFTDALIFFLRLCPEHEAG